MFKYYRDLDKEDLVISSDERIIFENCTVDNARIECDEAIFINCKIDDLSISGTVITYFDVCGKNVQFYYCTGKVYEQIRYDEITVLGDNIILMEAKYINFVYTEGINIEHVMYYPKIQGVILFYDDEIPYEKMEYVSPLITDFEKLDDDDASNSEMIIMIL